MRGKILIIILVIFIQLIVIKPNLNSRASQDVQSNEIIDENISSAEVNKLLKNIPRAFTENLGQLNNDNVRFYAQDRGLWFTDDGMWIEVREDLSINSQQSTVDSMESRLTTDNYRMTTCDYKRIVLKQEFVGANLVKPIGREPLGYYSNFFYGNDLSKWCTEVPNYREVYYENLYDGIDLRYYTSDNGLKYDFIVYPGAEIKQIRIKYKGIDELKIDNSKNLVINTPIEDLVDSDLFIYQDYFGQRNPVKGKFILFNNLEYGFKILDDYRQQEVLVIDPFLELEYSTFIGGKNIDGGEGIAIDTNGNIYITGPTKSSDFPTTPGVIDTSFNGGSSDCFVLKLGKNGTSINYSTFIGGSNTESGYETIAVDATGNAYVTSTTQSSDFPTTPNANDTTFNGGVNDVFVFKLNHNGSTLIYSTFVGGNAQDRSHDIAIDPLGNTFITGKTESIDFPTTSGAFDTSHNGSWDIFVLKLNQSGSILLYSTFVGGSNDDGDWQWYGGWNFGGIEVDLDGNAYIAGITNSSDFPTTPGAFDRTYGGEYPDTFVFKLNWNGEILLYSTYISGDKYELSRDIKIDLAGNAYVAGFTNSSNFPTTQDAYDISNNNSLMDGFILKLNPNGSKLLYSTFIGGSKDDMINSIVLDPLENVYAIGVTNSLDFPITPYAYDESLNGGGDAFVLKLNTNGSKLFYSSYIGGSSNDHGDDITMDIKGNVFITGKTASSDFPTMPGAFNRSLGFIDAFVAKFSFREVFNVTSVSLLMNNTPTTEIYSRLGTHTFRINITNTDSESDIGIVRLYLDPLNTNIQLLWDRVTGEVSEVFDPYNYVTLENSSKAYYDSFYNWTIDFNVTFNWTYPDEELHNVRAFVTNTLSSSIWLNKTNLYRVENDLVFSGTLTVTGDDNRTILNNSLVRGSEKLNWTGLTPVYEGTTDLYPPEDEIDVAIWEETNNYWSDSPAEGKPFNIKSITSNQSNSDGFNYTINLTGIPLECDKTNTTFSIRIDGDNVSFSNQRPKDDEWQTTNNVFVGVTITDTGGGYVNSSSVMQCISSNNGMTWGAWEPITELNDGTNIIVQKFATFEDGNDNLIKWLAKDSLDNGPTESESYKVLVDTQNLMFSNAWPSTNEESPTENVTVGITLSDLTSGVDSSRIKYSVSYDDGKTWDYWRSVSVFRNSNEVNVTLNLTFPNGTENRIKWQAYDIAGNGPVISEEYIINVNRIIPPIIPTVQLLTPQNNSVISTSSVELSWLLNNSGLTGVTYKVIVDDVYPPTNVKQSNLYPTNFMLTELEDGKTYYWTIIPKLDTNTGSCISGIWSFTVDIIHIRPSVTLISPPNGSIIQALRPTFVWTTNYDGTEELTYDIYVGKNGSLDIEILDYQDTNYLSKDTLVFNETYYWKVVPKAGGLEGIESKTWSFTIRPKDYIPTFGIELFLEPSIIEIEPGETRYVNAIVTNLGEITDKILLSIPELPISGLDIEINEPKIVQVEPSGTALFNITIYVKEDAKDVTKMIKIVAASGNAAGYNQVVEEHATLFVKISSSGKHDVGRSTGISEYWVLLIIIIVIIIILLFVGLILKRKQEPKEEPPEEITAPKTEHKLEPGQEPEQELAAEHTPENASEVVTTAPKASTSSPTTEPTKPENKTPTETIMPGQVPVPQIPEAPEQPQLPPADNEIKKEESDEETTQPMEQTTDSTNNEINEQTEVQTIPCPVCQNEVRVNTSSCPHCNTELNW